MNLSDYINLTLSEIAKGVSKATHSYEKTGNGQVLSKIQSPIEGIPIVRICGQGGGDIYIPIIKVAFRVGVEVEETKESNGKIGCSIKVVSADVETLTKGVGRSVHEVSFEIPLTLP